MSAAAVDASAPGGEHGGAHLARLVVSGATDEPSTVFFVVAAAAPLAGLEHTTRPRLTPAQVMIEPCMLNPELLSFKPQTPNPGFKPYTLDPKPLTLNTEP